jgi:hypothetical protein
MGQLAQVLAGAAADGRHIMDRNPLESPWLTAQRPARHARKAHLQAARAYADLP